MNAISLFSSVGVGEFYLNRIGVDVVAANELLPARAKTHSELYPTCLMINEDITLPSTQKKIIEIGKQRNVELVIATPPCQGVSSVGSNKSKDSIFFDPRNFLILPALNIVDNLEPSFIIIENVPRFQRMVFPYEGKIIPLSELLYLKYGQKYNIRCNILNAADYGIPQTRNRIVYRMWKKGLTWNLPPKHPHITLQEAIGNLPTLEANENSGIKNHNARQHPKNHIECMRYTETGKSAFKNKVHYPKKTDGSRITGYGNSYKRMRWDAPAPTITMRNEIISSQENVHPGRSNGDGTWSDARVLTLRELLIVSSLPPDMDQPTGLSETAFRQVIGEGIPPMMLEKIIQGIQGINKKHD